MKNLQYYLVGGAVRDQLLALPVKDRDWVVVGATPKAMLERGFKQVGADFPVFLHPETNEEYALARTERKRGQGYHGFVCDFSSDVSLEDDLARRDLSINAMAMLPDGELVDPFAGRADLAAKRLRHVSPAFSEDPLRILRTARFAARFHPLGFQVAEETLSLMSHMVNQGEADHLVAERIWQETQGALREPAAHVYFETLHHVGALAAIFPEVAVLFGVPQTEKWHPEVDTGVHALLSLQVACTLSSSPAVRWAALIHDLGKGLTPPSEWPRHIGHEKAGLKPIKALCNRLRAPTHFRDLALLVSEYHTHIHKAFELKPSTIHKVLSRCDAFRKPERFGDLLICCEADARGRKGMQDRAYPQAALFRQALEHVKQTDISAPLNSGLKAKALGEAIRMHQTDALARALPQLKQCIQ